MLKTVTLIPQLLASFPGFLGGLSPLAATLNHPSSYVRSVSAMLFERIAAHRPAGLRFVQALPLFHRLGLARVGSERLEDEQRPTSIEWTPYRDKSPPSLLEGSFGSHIDWTTRNPHSPMSTFSSSSGTADVPLPARSTVSTGDGGSYKPSTRSPSSLPASRQGSSTGIPSVSHPQSAPNGLPAALREMGLSEGVIGL